MLNMLHFCSIKWLACCCASKKSCRYWNWQYWHDIFVIASDWCCFPSKRREKKWYFIHCWVSLYFCNAWAIPVSHAKSSTLLVLTPKEDPLQVEEGLKRIASAHHWSGFVYKSLLFLCMTSNQVLTHTQTHDDSIVLVPHTASVSLHHHTSHSRFEKH